MLQTFDVIQEGVVMMKVEMLRTISMLIMLMLMVIKFNLCFIDPINQYIGFKIIWLVKYNLI